MWQTIWLVATSCNLILKIWKCNNRDIGKLSDCNVTWAHNDLVHKWTLNTWFVYKLSGCGFESRCSHLIFRYVAGFEQGVPWHSGNCRVWIHAEMRTWHDKNIQSNLYFCTIFCISQFNLDQSSQFLYWLHL